MLIFPYTVTGSASDSLKIKTVIFTFFLFFCELQEGDWVKICNQKGRVRTQLNGLLARITNEGFDGCRWTVEVISLQREYKVKPDGLIALVTFYFANFFTNPFCISNH